MEAVPLDDSALAAGFVHSVRAFSRRLRLVLHAGTPKTATTALQQTLFASHAALAERGIFYPPADVDPYHKKQQYLVDILLAADGAALAARLEAVVREAPPNTHTLLLSTEGLFNHWWDYPPRAKTMLRALTAALDVEVWVCFREPLRFALSQYAQLVRNPRQHSPAYGLDAGLDDILELDWFAKRLDYEGFVWAVAALIGARNVRVFRYGPDIVPRIFRALGAPEPARTRIHPSLRAPGVELMRIVNRYTLPPDEQDRAQALVLAIDELIGDAAEPLVASPAAERRVRELSEPGWAHIEALFALTEEPA